VASVSLLGACATTSSASGCNGESNHATKEQRESANQQELGRQPRPDDGTRDLGMGNRWRIEQRCL